MADSNGHGSASGLADSVRSAASRNPATERLLHSAEGYVSAQSEKLLGSLGEKVSGATKKLTDVASGSAEPSSLLGRTAKNVASGDSPAKAVGKGALGSLKDKVKGIFGKGRSPSGRKTMNIEESIDVGVPRKQAYNRWTQFTEFPKWSKGVQSVSQDDPTKSGWNAKIFLSKRNWNAKVTSQVPDERIAWTSDGPKGTVDGVVTFHELTPNLTRILLALEYHPAGLFEKTGNIWRAQGRRVRLDLKLYRRFVMMSNEEVEGWRGEIRDGEVVREHDEVVAEEERDQQDTGDENDEDTGDDDTGDEDTGDEAEDAYDEDEGEGEGDEDYDEDDYGDEAEDAYDEDDAGDEGDTEDDDTGDDDTEDDAEDAYDEDEDEGEGDEDYDDGDGDEADEDDAEEDDAEEQPPARRRRAS